VLLFQIFLDLKEKNNTEYKLETSSAVYHYRLCEKDVVFEYLVAENA
jgi:small subunit ribosomal protein S7e